MLATLNFIAMIGFFVTPVLAFAITVNVDHSILKGAVAGLVSGLAGVAAILLFSNFALPALVAGILAPIFSLGVLDKMALKTFTSHVEACGLKPDFMAVDQGSGIAIDLSGRRVFAGTATKGRAVGFSEVAGVQWASTGGSNPKYLLKILTHNFDHPQLIVSFASRKSKMEEAFSKLRVALALE